MTQRSWRRRDSPNEDAASHTKHTTSRITGIIDRRTTTRASRSQGSFYRRVAPPAKSFKQPEMGQTMSTHYHLFCGASPCKRGSPGISIPGRRSVTWERVTGQPGNSRQSTASYHASEHRLRQPTRVPTTPGGRSQLRSGFLRTSGSQSAQRDNLSGVNCLGHTTVSFALPSKEAGTDRAQRVGKMGRQATPPRVTPGLSGLKRRIS